MLKGPTGCGKTRFVEYMAAKLGRKLITVACNEDTTATDLLGRHLLIGGETRWTDGPVTRAVREGAILYLDEVAEARADAIVVIHSLTDHRRELFLDRTGETLHAPPEFMLVISYNPGYQRSMRELKPSTRQRFIGLGFGYPSTDIETRILTAKQASMTNRPARSSASPRKSAHSPSSRCSKAFPPACSSMPPNSSAGLPPRYAATVAIAEPLTDDPDALAAIRRSSNSRSDMFEWEENVFLGLKALYKRLVEKPRERERRRCAR
jgi:nitric oxide reductase NorQ protein